MIILVNKITGENLGAFEAETKREALKKLSDSKHYKTHMIIAHKIT